MCTISRETVMRASARSMSRPAAQRMSRGTVNMDTMTASTRFMGKEYSVTLTMAELRESYGRARKKIVHDVKAV